MRNPFADSCNRAAWATLFGLVFLWYGMVWLVDVVRTARHRADCRSAPLSNAATALSAPCHRETAYGAVESNTYRSRHSSQFITHYYVTVRLQGGRTVTEELADSPRDGYLPEQVLCLVTVWRGQVTQIKIGSQTFQTADSPLHEAGFHGLIALFSLGLTAICAVRVGANTARTRDWSEP